MLVEPELGLRGLPQAHPAAGLESVDPAEWDALVPPGRGPLRYAPLRAWERCELRGLRSHPLIVREPDGGDLVAAAPGYLYDLDALMIHRSLVARVVKAVRAIMPRLLLMRVYELGSSAPIMTPFLHSARVDPEAAADRLLEAAVREAGANDVQMVIVQDFEPGDSTHTELLRKHGFSPVPMHPTVVVYTPFATFEDYLGAMRANYRRRAKQVFKRSKELRPELVRDFEPLAPELARLWHLVYERATEYRRERLPAAYWEAAAEDERMSVLLLRRPDDSIASFALLHHDKPFVHFLSVGFEEEAGRDEGAYFRLLYEIIRVAIEERCEYVDLGLTTVEPKLDVGGVQVPLVAWMRHKNKAVQRVFAKLGGGAFAPEMAEPRRVFKD